MIGSADKSSTDKLIFTTSVIDREPISIPIIAHAKLFLFNARQEAHCY